MSVRASAADCNCASHGLAEEHRHGPNCPYGVALRAQAARERSVEALVSEYVRQTAFCSVRSHMEQQPAFGDLARRGELAIPALLCNLASDDSGGMAVMHMLAHLSREWPEYDALAEPVGAGFVGIDVRAASEAWLSWGRAKGLIP